MLNRQKRKLILPFLLPALLLYGGLFLYPAIRTLLIAFTSWDGITDAMTYVGLDNFAQLVRDKSFLNSITNTFVFVIMGGAVLFPLAFFFAFATSERLRGAKVFRFVILAPIALSISAVALLWKFVLDPNFGLLNESLRAIGLDALAAPWLGQTSTAMLSVVLATVWSGVGIWMVFIAAAISRVPEELKEAARIEGASSAQVFRHVVLPLIADITRILLVLWVIQGLQVFGFVVAMTNGGPLNATQVMGTYLFDVAFTERRWGYAAAIAVVMFLMIMIFAAVVSRLSRRDRVTY